MAPAETACALRVEVACSPRAGEVQTVTLQLAVGASVADALQASGLLLRHGLDIAVLRVGVWGRPCDLQTVLRDHDRVEIYRPLTVDPKEARRLRYQRHRQAWPAA
jgi:putative ubiquitin-RnfH superfamily antitoxin RatB of RatAB toxin-antitoxin module